MQIITIKMNKITSFAYKKMSKRFTQYSLHTFYVSLWETFLFHINSTLKFQYYINCIISNLTLINSLQYSLFLNQFYLLIKGMLI